MSTFGTVTVASPQAGPRLTGCVKFGTNNLMVDRTKKLPARFFVSAAGRKPVREWILDLPESDRYIIGKDIQKVEFGWPLGRPHCASLGSGLWEVRSSLAGNRIARVIFCVADGCMILLHGFIKKTQKTAKADIDLALARKCEVVQ
jgi:phage-related protein